MITNRTKDYLFLALMAESMMDKSIVYEQQEISEKKVTDRLRIKKGHKVFKAINGQVSEVGEDEYAESLYESKYRLDFDLGRKVRKLIPEEGEIYVSALNMKNAIKKFKKLGAVEASQ